MHYNIRKSYVVADAAGVPGGGPQARRVCRRRAAGPAAEPPKRAEPVCPGAAGAACGSYACPLQGAAEEKNADSGARKK